MRSFFALDAIASPADLAVSLLPWVLLGVLVAVAGPWPDWPGKTPIRSLRSLTGVFKDGLRNPVGQGG